MHQAQVHALLYQALETELGGIHVYQTALQCTVNAHLKQAWQGTEMPPAQALLLWLHGTVPNVAARVLARARYYAQSAPGGGLSGAGEDRGTRHRRRIVPRMPPKGSRLA